MTKRFLLCFCNWTVWLWKLVASATKANNHQCDTPPWWQSSSGIFIENTPQLPSPWARKIFSESNGYNFRIPSFCNWSHPYITPPGLYPFDSRALRLFRSGWLSSWGFSLYNVGRWQSSSGIFKERNERRINLKFL